MKSGKESNTTKMALITAFFSKFTLNGNGLNSTNKKTEL
jgi:hypothetical protein